MGKPVTRGGGSLFLREAAEAPAVLRAQRERNAEAIASLAGRLRGRRPRAVVTCARGSSDHAATYAKYLFETRLGVLTASAAPSVASVYGARPDVRDCLFIVLSQSGRSPDLLEAARAALEGGAQVVAMVNDEASPLAGTGAHVIALHAGVERSVAASKSYIAMLAALAHLAAAWAGDERLLADLEAAPEALERAGSLDWSAALPALSRAAHLYVVARGVGLCVAQEAALKCKEACGLHAESFSAAEVRHGPQALLRPGFPAFLLGQDDATRADLEALGRELVERDVEVIVAGLEVEGAIALPAAPIAPALAPLALARSFYGLADALARERGCDPDVPPHLAKVTRTL